jgi:hypothetical protein
MMKMKLYKVCRESIMECCENCKYEDNCENRDIIRNPESMRNPMSCNMWEPKE